jgi:hypothetical protein
VTGRLSTNLFDDRCVFDGPDPDMPVAGLAKYLAATSQLFSHKLSRCELVGVGVIDDLDPLHGSASRRSRGAWLRLPALGLNRAGAHHHLPGLLPLHPGDSTTVGPRGQGVVVLWRIQGVVNLPWHPTIKPYYGCTLFERAVDDGPRRAGHLGGEGYRGGLIIRATEWWSLPVLAAFCSAVPAFRHWGGPDAPPASVLRGEPDAGVVGKVATLAGGGGGSGVGPVGRPPSLAGVMSGLVEMPQALVPATRFLTF